MDTIAPQNVLITGASGYIGARVVERLAARHDGRRIVALDVRAPDHPVPGVHHAIADIRSREQLDALLAAHPVDAIIHLAAIIDPPRNAPEDFAWQVDVIGTRNILDVARAHAIHHFITTSSGAAYGYHPDNPQSLDEDAPLRGNAVFAYSHHKRVIEHLLADWRREWPALRQLVLRPGTVLGATTRNRITKLFSGHIIMGLREAASPFVFVHDDDLVTCILHGLDDPDLQGVFNVAGRGTMGIADIAKALGRPYVAVPRRLVRAALAVRKRFQPSGDGPEQALFLEHRPVLDGRALEAAFGIVLKSTHETFAIWQKAHTHG